MEEYKKAVLAHYEAVKDNLHPDFLSHPTTARLRSLCTVLFDSLNVDDRVIFTRFFKTDSLDVNLNFNDVAKFDIDKFKPLVRFMKGGSPPTKPASIELFAILVDFQPRPLKKFNKVGIKQVDHVEEYDRSDKLQTLYDSKSEEKENIHSFNSDINDEKTEVSIVTDFQIGNEGTVTKNPPIIKDPRGKYIKLALVLLVTIGGVFLAKSDLLKEKGCMIWDKDHYEKVACDDELDPSEGKKIIAIDEKLLKYQKKINIADTTTLLNPDGTNKFFYGKNANQKMEYFTLPGEHPETGKKLKYLSNYMIRKYFVNINGSE